MELRVFEMKENYSATGHRIHAQLSPERAAYILYTSGSTGKPKGAVVPHRAVCSLLRCMQEAYRLCPEDRVLQKTAYTFDVSVPEFFWPLAIGAAMVLTRPAYEADPNIPVALLNSSQFSTFNLFRTTSRCSLI